MRYTRMVVLGLAVMAVALVATLSGSSLAQQSGEARKPEVSILNHALKGLHEARIIVENVDNRASSRTGITRASLKTTLQATLLGSNTIEVIEEGYGPYIYLHVSLLPQDRLPKTVLNVRLQLCELVYVRRPQCWQLVPTAETWHTSSLFGIAPDNEVAQVIKDAIRDMVDKFTIAWHEANPQ